MKPLSLSTGDGKSTTNISRTFNIENVVSVEDTILDKEFIENGATIDLPEEMNGILVKILPESPVNVNLFNSSISVFF